MREIICRGKREDNHEWVAGRLLGEGVIAPRGQELLVDMRGNKLVIDEDTEVICYVVDDKTVGQYIGINDINDEKLYEGDIVKMELDADIVISGYITYRGAAFYVATGADLWDIDCYYTIEKLGNIHDNPELLKGE